MTRTKHRIGRFRVIAPIGAGGFSTVYRALDEDNDREVAIKVLAENHSLVPETRRRFVEEFNLRGTVESPFIAKMFEVGETETGQPYMVLELADRGDLRRRVEEFRRSHAVLSQRDLLTLAQHLTEALSALHDVEIVHRDVSPGNILIRSRPSRGGRPANAPTASPESSELLEPGERFLLADLGHAKDLFRSSGFTAGGGTQGFAAPEQQDDITVVDHRADIFSATAIIEWAAHDGPYAETLEPFFDRGLASEPENRFRSMNDWYEALAGALGVEDEPAGLGLLERWFGREDDSPGHQSSSDNATDRPDREWPPAEAAWSNPPRQTPGIAVGLAATAAAAVAVLVVLAAFEINPFSDESDPVGRLDSADVPPTNPPTTDDQPAPPDGDTQETLVVADPEPIADVTIDEPPEGVKVTGNVVITGSVAFRSTATDIEVELVVQNVDTGQYWDPVGGLTGTERGFRLELTSVTDSGGRFRAEAPYSELSIGQYRVAAWAVEASSPPGTPPSAEAAGHLFDLV